MRPDTVLAFDTSAAHCAAALLWDGRVISRHEAMQKGQAERLMPLLEALLAEAGIGWRDLDLLAVGTGPGNFTGVRIAVAAARGLALGLGIPALGVSRLEAMAHGAARPVTVVDAARGGAFHVQTFHAEGAGEVLLMPATALGPPGAHRVGSDGRAPAQPLAEAMAQIARLRGGGGGARRPAPFYLRGADASPPADPPPVILP